MYGISTYIIYLHLHLPTFAIKNTKGKYSIHGAHGLGPREGIFAAKMQAVVGTGS